MEKDLLQKQYDIINKSYIKPKDVMVLLNVNRTYAYQKINDFKLKSKKKLPFKNFIPTSEFLKFIKFDVEYILNNYKKMTEGD